MKKLFLPDNIRQAVFTLRNFNNHQKTVGSAVFLFWEVFLIVDLTAKQKRFCEEYLIDLNGTRAYMAAYICKKEDTARVNASRMLTNANIQKYISELMEKQSERTNITADKVLSELEKVAFTDAEITGKEKIKALELLGKHLGMFDNKPSDTGNEAEIPKLMEALKDDVQ